MGRSASLRTPAMHRLVLGLFSEAFIAIVEAFGNTEFGSRDSGHLKRMVLRVGVVP